MVRGLLSMHALSPLFIVRFLSDASRQGHKTGRRPPCSFHNTTGTPCLWHLKESPFEALQGIYQEAFTSELAHSTGFHLLSTSPCRACTKNKFCHVTPQVLRVACSADEKLRLTMTSWPKSRAYYVIRKVLYPSQAHSCSYKDSKRMKLLIDRHVRLSTLDRNTLRKLIW